MIRAGIVGLGRWGQRLVDAVNSDDVNSDDVNTNGIEKSGPSELIRYTHGVTRSPQKVVDFCEKNKIELVDSYDSLLANPDIDAIVLATPHSQHIDQIVLAAKANKPIFVEKPVALERNHLSRGIQACVDSGVILAAGFNRRFLPAYQFLESQLAQGELGTSLHVEGAFSGPFGYSYTKQMWRGTQAENPAGGMAAMGIHVLDAMIHLLGPVASVLAVSQKLVVDSDVDDTTSVMLNFESGASGYLSTLMATAQTFRLQLYGSKGWTALRDQETLDTKNIEGELSTQKFPLVDIERREQEAFAQAITTNLPYAVTYAEIISGVATMEAIVKSAKLNGQRVIVEN